MSQQNIISHGSPAGNLQSESQRLAAAIPLDADREARLRILEELQEFELGRYLILNRGLNGYWTHYICTHPQRRPVLGLSDLETAILNRFPIVLATQERFKHFQKALQRHLRDEAKLASIPCGLMGDLLLLDHSDTDDVKLVGVDLDPDSISAAKSLAIESGCEKIAEFAIEDAWNLTAENEFSAISSNGLNIYEPNDERVTALYGRFCQALKPGGDLITSFLTPPPTAVECSWDMAKIDLQALALQKTIFLDILQAKWQCYRTEAQTTSQLEQAGFSNIQFVYDKARIFPTVIAERPK